MTTASAAGKKPQRLKDIAVSVTDMYRLDPATIVIREDFNPRDFTRINADPELRQREEEFAHNIGRNGVKQAVVVQFKDGAANLVDGERRVRGALRARELGYIIDTIPAVSEPRGITDDERQFSTFTYNQSEDFTMLELGKLFARQIGVFGWTEEKIAERWGKSPSHVRNVLSLYEASDEVKALVKSGAVSQSQAATLVRKVGSTEAAAQIKATNAATGKRATASQIARVNNNVNPTANSPTRRYNNVEATTVVKAMREIHSLTHDKPLRNFSAKDMLGLAERVAVISQNVLENFGIVEAKFDN